MRPLPPPENRKTGGLTLAVLASALMVAGCINAPELDQVEPKNLSSTPYPRLIPLGPVLAQTGTPSEDAADEQDALTARVANLNARAAALSAEPVIDAESKARLDEASAQAQ